jgi:hypothetical protein
METVMWPDQWGLLSVRRKGKRIMIRGRKEDGS